MKVLSITRWTVLNRWQILVLTTRKTSKSWDVRAVCIGYPKSIWRIFSATENVKRFRHFNNQRSYDAEPEVLFSGLRMWKLMEIKSKNVLLYANVFSIFIQQKMNGVTWYTEARSITSTQRIYLGAHQERPSFCSSVLRWVQKLRECGTVEIQCPIRRPSTTQEDERSIPGYFNGNQRTSSRLVEIRSGLPKSCIQWRLWNPPAFFDTGFILFRSLNNVIVKLVLDFLTSS